MKSERRICREKWKLLVWLTVLMIGSLLSVNTLEVKAGTYMSGDQIANYCNSKVGTGYPAGYCLGWVSNVFQSLGAERSCGCCAYNYGRSRIVSTSDSDIPVGADVFFSGSQTRCSSCGNTCGHVAIYVGGGYVVHSYGGSIHKDTLARVKSWSGYSYMGWGIHGNVDLDHHHDPEGCVDAIEPHGEGKVLVRGWTFDRDVPGNALEIHVYIGGPAGSAGVEGHVVGHADKSRPDVDNVFHTGSNHGFEFVIDTGKSGNQAVYVYAINQGGGTNNPAIGNKTINIAPAHTHIAAPAVKENEKKATCTDTGSYDEVVYCSACHAQMSRNQKTVAVLGHDWGEWTVEKEATEKEAGLEVRVCKRDKNHQEEREIPQIVHQHILKQVAEKLPECEADGYETYWRCEGCGRMFEDADADVELDEEEVVLEAVGHVSGEPVTEHVIAAGCETEGADEKIVCCSVCGKELQREQIATEPAGHDYGEWTVIEEPAQGKKGLKIRVCRKDAGHIDKEEIPALEEAENGTGSDVSEGESDGGEQNLQSNSQASNGIEENLNNEPAGQDSENRSQASDRNNLNRELVGQNLESTPDRNGDISKQASEDGQKTDSAQQVVSGVEGRGSGGQKADDLREGYSEALGDPAGGVEKTVDIQSSVAIENPSGETGIQGQGMEQKDAVTEDRTGDKTDADRTVTSKEGVKDVINVEKDSLWNEEQKAGTIETVGETQTKEEVSAIERTKTDAEPQMAGEPKTDTKLWMNGESQTDAESGMDGKSQTDTELQMDGDTQIDVDLQMDRGLQPEMELPKDEGTQREIRVEEETKEPDPVKAGMIIEDRKGSLYCILSTEKRTAEYVLCASANDTVVSIPDSIIVDGRSYSIVSIAEGAFESNRTIKKVTIGKNVRVIGESAFANCKNLKNVVIGENVSHICREAFNGCRKLNGITLPESVKEIGNNAFSGCKKLRSLTIHSTRMTSKTLSRSAFKGLSKKTVVRVPSNMRKTYKKLFVKKGLSKKARIR